MHAQFVADGVFYAELNELLTRELAEDGYSGVEVRVTPMRTEIIIRATRTQSVLGGCLTRACVGAWRPSAWRLPAHAAVIAAWLLCGMHTATCRFCNNAVCLGYVGLQARRAAASAS